MLQAMCVQSSKVYPLQLYDLVVIIYANADRYYVKCHNHKSHTAAMFVIVYT
jgi:hypothetical protein